jgi:hypothetical protein
MTLFFSQVGNNGLVFDMPLGWTMEKGKANKGPSLNEAGPDAFHPLVLLDWRS